VWANPVHYAHQMARPLVGGTPLKVEVACETYSTRHSFGQIPAHENVPMLDVLAVLDEEGRHLIVTLVNRSANRDPVAVTVSAGELAIGPEAKLVSLSGDTMYDQNTLDEPNRIVPRTQRVPVVAGQVQLSFSSYTLARLTFDV
jgi:alpha-N-arabinofuranosidase